MADLKDLKILVVGVGTTSGLGSFPPGQYPQLMLEVKFWVGTLKTAEKLQKRAGFSLPIGPPLPPLTPDFRGPGAAPGSARARGLLPGDGALHGGEQLGNRETVDFLQF